MGISASLGSSALLPAGLGFRNTLVNGSFLVDQRNSSAAQTITAAAVLAYTTDRWYAYCTGANVTSQRIAGSAPFQYNHQFTGATSNTLVGFGQRIEAANSFNYAGNTATLSAYIKSSSLTSITWTLYYATTTDSFGTIASPTRTQIATGTFTISSVLTRFSTQISVPAAATTGLELVFTTGALVASQTLVFAGVQLEQNYQATPFEQRPIGVELALCQRYFYQMNAAGTYNYYAAGNAGSANGGNVQINMPVPFRAQAQDLTTSNVTLSDYAVNVTSGTLSISTALSNTNTTSLLFTSTGAYTVYRSYVLLANNTLTSSVSLSAEL